MLHLNLFGAPSVRADGRPVGGAAAQPRRLALLALLARAGDRGITRDKVLGTLWPDQEEEKARRALTHALYALRRDLGSDEAIEGSRDLRFNPALIASDLADYLQARAEGRAADAAAAYAGPLMDGFHVPDAPEFERWLDTERHALAVDYAEVLEKLAEGAGKAGDARAAAGWWRKRAALDPLDARIAVALMQALAESGDTGSALRHAAVFESLLEQELGLAQDRTVASYAAKLRAQPVAVPEAPAAARSVAAPAARDAAAPGAGNANVYRLVLPAGDADIGSLAEVLVDAVESGAAVSFLAPLTVARAVEWWRGTLAGAHERAIFLVARDAQGIVGTVQVHPAWAPNQPHRGEIVKLLVHRRAQRAGLGRSLMEAAEAEARRAGYGLLTLDAKTGGAADRLYRSMGWTVAGTIPRYAFDTDGSTPHDATIFFKELR